MTDNKNERKIETICVQAGYEPENGQPRVVPICQSTTFKYDNGDILGDLFDLKAAGYFYTRLSNPTVAAVEAKIAALEGGVGAMCTSSGQAATMTAILNIVSAGQNFISTQAIYGGSTNLFAVTLANFGIEARFVDQYADDETVEALFDENTRAVFGETCANPGLDILDIERFAALAHRRGVPLIIDNTFATPIFCRPFEFGADIVVHSTSKYMDGHAMVLGGVVVDSGNFNWAASDKFPGLTKPDASYHGVVYTEAFGKAAYITKARTQLMRDLGMTPQPSAAFLLSVGLETLALRMERHSENAQAVAEYLQGHDKVLWVNYPGLADSPQHERLMKYMPRGCCGVVSFGIRGGREAAMAFMNALKLAAIVIHVADLRTSVLHPASTTHRQLTDEQLTAAGIGPEFIRFSVGIEHKDDIIADLAQALATI